MSNQYDVTLVGRVPEIPDQRFGIFCGVLESLRENYERLLKANSGGELREELYTIDCQLKHLHQRVKKALEASNTNVRQVPENVELRKVLDEIERDAVTLGEQDMPPGTIEDYGVV